MQWQDYIETRPEIMLGKPVFKGTRITVELILQRLGQGETTEQLLTSYPQLSDLHVTAAHAYAAAVLANEETIFPHERAG